MWIEPGESQTHCHRFCKAGCEAITNFQRAGASQRRHEAFGAVPDQKSSAAIPHDRIEPRQNFHDLLQTGDADDDEDSIGKGTGQAYREDEFVSKSLPQYKCILRTDGDDQAQPYSHSGEIGHKIHMNLLNCR